MNTQAQAQATTSAKSDEAILADVIDVTSTATGSQTVSKKPGLLARSKAHVSRNKGKYSFAVGVAVGAAAGVAYSVWKVGGSDVAPIALPAGDAPAV